jgi:hypothetical protein
MCVLLHWFSCACQFLQKADMAFLEVKYWRHGQCDCQAAGAALNMVHDGHRFLLCSGQQLGMKMVIANAA